MSRVMQTLAEEFDAEFPDETVLIGETAHSDDTLIISVSGEDKDTVAKRAHRVAEEVRSNHLFSANDGRVTVERMTNDDHPSSTEHYDVLAILG